MNAESLVHAWRRQKPTVPWPALLDLITSTLMVFLLITFLQIAFGDDPEAVFTRSKQESFVQQFEKEFTREIADKKIQAEHRLNFLQITFSDGVLFESGDYRLQPGGQQLLVRCAKVFENASQTGYEQIQVEGHTDDRPIWHTGYPSDNWELSSARAISVVRFLNELGGVTTKVFSANGYSFHRPVASNDTEEGRAHNRRVEIRLFFSGTATESLLTGQHRDP